MFEGFIRNGSEFLQKWARAAAGATTSSSAPKAGQLFKKKTAVKALRHLIQFPDPVVEKLETEPQEEDFPKFKVRVKKREMGDAAILRKTDEIIARDEGPRCGSFALLVEYYPAELERLGVVSFLLDRALHGSFPIVNPYGDALKWGLVSNNSVELYRKSRVFERIDEALSSDDTDVQSWAIWLAGKLIRGKNSAGLVPATTIPKLEKLLFSLNKDVQRKALSAFIDITEGFFLADKTSAGVNLFRPETYRALTHAMLNQNNYVVSNTLRAIERAIAFDGQVQKVDFETIGKLIGIVGSKEIQDINETVNNILDKVLAYQRANSFPAFGKRETDIMMASYIKKMNSSGDKFRENYQERMLFLARIGKFVDAMPRSRRGLSKRWRATPLEKLGFT